MTSTNTFGWKTALQGEVIVCDSGGETGKNVIRIEDVGDFNISFPKAVIDWDENGETRFAAVNDFFLRGRFKTSRMGQQEPITGSFTVPLTAFTYHGEEIDKAAAAMLAVGMFNPNRAADKRTPVDDWTPVNGTRPEVPHFKLVFVKRGLKQGESRDHKVKLSEVEYKVSSMAEAMETDTVSVEFRAWTLEDLV